MNYRIFAHEPNSKMGNQTNRGADGEINYGTDRYAEITVVCIQPPRANHIVIHVTRFSERGVPGWQTPGDRYEFHNAVGGARRPRPANLVICEPTGSISPAKT